MFFEKTNNLIDKISSINIFDKDTLQKGIDFNMLSMRDKDFFRIKLDGTLYFACAYLSVIDEAMFAKYVSPRIHFILCDDLISIDKTHMKVCIPKTNSFDYKVRANGIDTRLFYEHPLKICPVCVNYLCKILSKKHNKNITSKHLDNEKIMNMIIQNKLKNII